MTGDGRTYDRVCAIRAVTSTDCITANFYPFLPEFTGRVGTRIVNEIAYSLDQPFWRQGFATEAARAARDWLFAQFPVPRIASFIRPDNHGSKRVAERLGAIWERTFELRGAAYEHWAHYRAGGQS